MAVYPKSLGPGATLGVVSPSSAASAEKLVKGVRVLESQGFRVVVHPQNDLTCGHLAGTDAQRRDALLEMFADPAIDGIICGRGGNGAIRLLDSLDYDLIRRNPKPFIGYSDITVLHHAIHNRAGLVTYQGPMVASFGGDYDPRSLTDLIEVLAQAGQGVEKVFADVEVLTPGAAEGTLIGGNMTMLQSILGTPYGWDARGAILFIEDVDELIYRLDRMLHHFRYAGKLDGVAAVLVGEMVNVPDGETSFQKPGERPYGRTVQQILRDNFPPEVPMVMNVPCSHGRYLTTLPIGGRARVEIGEAGLKLTLLAAG